MQEPADGSTGPAGSPEAPAPAATGWTAPLKPGLIPLRPLQFADVLSASFRLLRTSPGVTVGSAILVLFATSLLSGVATGVVAYLMFDRAASATTADRSALETTAAVVTMLTAMATVVFSLAGSALLQGVLTHVVTRAAVAERATFADAWRTAFRRGWALIGYTLGAGLATLVAIGALVGLIMLPVLLTGGENTGGVVATALLALVGYLAVLAGLLVLGVKLLFVAPAIVLEGLGPLAAIRRSWSLTKGQFWRLLGITVVVQLIVSFVSGAVSSVLQLVLPLLTAILIPLGMGAEDQGWIVVGIIVVVLFLSLALQLVVSALALVLVAGNAVILYLDVRMRKEGLNVYLQRYRDDVAAGREPGEDPYTAPPLEVPPAAVQPYGQYPVVAPPNTAAGYHAWLANGAPSGYLSQGYAPAGYAPQGYAAPGYAPQGYAPTGYAPQGYAPAGNAPQGYAPQGYAVPGFAPQGYPPQGYAHTGSAPQGDSTAGTAAQGDAPSGSAGQADTPAETAPRPSTSDSPRPGAHGSVPAAPADDEAPARDDGERGDGAPGRDDASDRTT